MVIKTFFYSMETTLISKKATLHGQHIFFVHLFAVVLDDYNVKLPKTTLLHVLWRRCSTFSRSFFFSLPLIFTLHWWPLAFLILSPPLQNFHVVLPTENVSLQISVVLFLVELRWPAAYFISFSVFLLFYCWFSVSRHSKQIKIKIKTVQQIKSRIWEMKGGKYTKTLAKIWVEGIIRIRDIRGNVLPKFIELCMETPCWSSSG